MRRVREAYIEQRKYNEADPYVRTMRALPKDIDGIQGVIKKLRLFPGKALGELLVNVVQITERGLATHEGLLDRSFMLGRRNRNAGKPGEPDYERFSQREEPSLVRITPEFDGKILMYTVPGVGRMELPLKTLVPRAGTPKTVAVAGDILTVTEEEEGGPINTAIRRYLSGTRHDVSQLCALFPHATFTRQVEERHRAGQEGQTSLTDGGQVLLSSEADRLFLWDQIKKRHGENQREPQMKQYRPNIEVWGWPAHLTDVLQEAAILGRQNLMPKLIPLYAGDLSIRCKVTKVNTETGEFLTDDTPWESIMLDRPRRLDGKKIPTFAVNGIFPKEAWGAYICRGDTIISVKEKLTD